MTRDATGSAPVGALGAWLLRLAGPDAQPSVERAISMLRGPDAAGPLAARLSAAARDVAAELRRRKREHDAQLIERAALVAAPAPSLAATREREGLIAIRSPLRGEMPAFLEEFDRLRLAQGPVAPEGVRARGEQVAAADAAFLLVEDEAKLLAGCAVFNGDSRYVEVSSVLSGKATTPRLVQLVVALHCIRASALEPDRHRVYWSAMPQEDAEEAAALRRSGFARRGDLLPRLRHTFAYRPGLAQAAWFAASPRTVAERFVMRARSLGAGRSWADLLDVRDRWVLVELGGEWMELSDFLPLAESVADAF